MTLKDIAIGNLRRRKTKALFVLAGLLLGVSTVVALVSLMRVMREDINPKLEMYGAIFDRQESGELNQRPFGGQTFRRTCFQGDRTGHEMMMALKEEVIRRGIKTIEEMIITTLITHDDDGGVLGACGLSLKDSSFHIFQAKSTIIATGGAGWMYPVTSNAMQKTGDGFALAYQSGTDLLDMEQVQFHPTGMLYPESRRGVLITEAVRGEVPIVRTCIAIFRAETQSTLVHAEDEGLFALVMLGQKVGGLQVDAVVREVLLGDNLGLRI